jgi:hypothetical protein
MLSKIAGIFSPSPLKRLPPNFATESFLISVYLFIQLTGKRLAV